MHPFLGWALAAVLFAIGGQAYGWRGVVAAATATIFWLLLQFNRAMRVMRNAADAPVGHVPSAVMLNAKLRPGMTMLQVVALTRSLGRQLDASADRWQWQDDSASSVTLEFARGKLARHVLERPAEPAPSSAGAPPAAP